jgi:hypothetical protein
MAQYLRTNAEGRPTGFFNIPTGGKVPANAVEVTSEQYAELWSNRFNSTFLNGKVTLGPATVTGKPPAAAMQARRALGAGLTISSTAFGAALNGTYSIEDRRVSIAADLATLITAGGSFPKGAASWVWPDIQGRPHVFTSPSVFVAFYHALAAYRLVLTALIDGAPGELPPATAAIP